MKTLLGSDALVGAQDARETDDGSLDALYAAGGWSAGAHGAGAEAGARAGVPAAQAALTREPLHARPGDWRWWSPSDALPPQLPSPIVNAAAVARVLHGIHSALFSWRDFRPVGGAFGHRGHGQSLWATWAAYRFEDVREVAERVLEGMARARV
jgi:hypothetical protein